MKIDTKPIANIIGTVKRILPLQIVVSQLNTLIADGIAINRVNSTNTEPKNGLIPDTNIWCAHTTSASEVIPIKEIIIAR
ncbi:hypothetical protein D3C80_1874500 [compost metagenome]